MLKKNFTKRNLTTKIHKNLGFSKNISSTLVDNFFHTFNAELIKEKQIKMTDKQSSYFGLDKLNVVRSEVPAITHVDRSARIQTVDRQTNPRYHALITRFREISGCPVIVNTSFNVRGEPIVCTPEDAFKCFMGTETELLVVGNSIMRKENQDPALKHYYKDAFEFD